MIERLTQQCCLFLTGATPSDQRSTLKQYFSYGLRFSNEQKEGINEFFETHVQKYAEFPALVPPIVAKESTIPRKSAGGFMVAGDKNEDIVHPILRPDLDDADKTMYEDIATKLGYDSSLKDNESYMQFMNYNQIAYLELVSKQNIINAESAPLNTNNTSSVNIEENQVNTNTMSWKDWPAVAYKEVGHPLVMKGDTFYNHARELLLSKHDGRSIKDEFLDIYVNRPDTTNLCGIRINHALALFLAVKQLQPSLVVESGVNAGVSTYFIRAASNTTKIYAIDPLDEPICKQGTRWIDPSHLTTYFTGDKFVDLLDLDWKGMLERKEVDPESTLVFLDDHLHVYDRINAVMQYGLRHFVTEDNYKAGEGLCCNIYMCLNVLK